MCVEYLNFQELDKIFGYTLVVTVSCTILDVVILFHLSGTLPHILSCPTEGPSRRLRQILILCYLITFMIEMGPLTL